MAGSSAVQLIGRLQHCWQVDPGKFRGVTLGSNFLPRSREETLTSYTFAPDRATCFTAKTLLLSASSTALGEGIPSRRRAGHFKIDREETRLEGEAPTWPAVQARKIQDRRLFRRMELKCTASAGSS